MKKGVKFFEVFLIAGFLYLLTGCSNNPTSPTENQKPKSSVEQLSENGAAIFNTYTNVKDLSDLLKGPDAKVDVGIPGVENPQSAGKFARQMIRNSFLLVKSQAKPLMRIQDATGDTVIWDVTIRRELLGFTERNSLIYNPETGHARLFEVRFDFDERHRLDYDSTEIKVDLNFTIFDDSDDVLLSLENLQRFKPGRPLRERHVSFIPDPHDPGTEPQGGVLESTVTYDPSRSIQKTHERLEYHEGSGGSYSKEVEFSDGTKHLESVTFNDDGTGTFLEVRRDGTRIEGTFDCAEDDGQGSFSRTITFPQGHDPVSIQESGEFSENLADSTLHGSYMREVTFQDGTVKRESITVDESTKDGIKTTVIDIENADGSGGTITVVEEPEVDKISGQWTNEDGTFLIFSAEAYPDGSAHFKFELYASKQAYENGEDPIAKGEFNYFPDGSGEGTVTADGQTQNVTVNPDGSVDS